MSVCVCDRTDQLAGDRRLSPGLWSVDVIIVVAAAVAGQKRTFGTI